MKTTRNKWTKEEDEILVQAVKANPHNKTQAFRETALKVNHSIYCCSNRWYGILSNPNNKNYVGCCFAMVGNNSKLGNRTVNRQGVHVKPTKSSLTIWSKIKKLLGL